MGLVERYGLSEDMRVVDVTTGEAVPLRRIVDLLNAAEGESSTPTQGAVDALREAASEVERLRGVLAIIGAAKPEDAARFARAALDAPHGRGP